MLEILDAIFPREKPMLEILHAIFPLKNPVLKILDAIFPQQNPVLKILDAIFPRENPILKILDAIFPWKAAAKKSATHFLGINQHLAQQVPAYFSIQSANNFTLQHELC